jgi:hypothetical protein
MQEIARAVMFIDWPNDPKQEPTTLAIPAPEFCWQISELG